ncbi:MAG: hypothetical protein NVS2B12_01690 [Ktedonobacteraceae bacterium]
MNGAGLTNSWIWTQTWLEHHGDIVQPVFAFARYGNQIIGATLIVTAIYKRKNLPILPITRVHIGTGKYTKYNRLLVAPAYLDIFAMALIRTLQNRLRWSELHLDGFAPEHATALLRAGKNAGLLFQVEDNKSPAFDFRKAVEDGHEDIISALGKNTRYNLRRSARLFKDMYGQQTLEWAETEEQAKDILKELIELNQKRWNNVQRAGAFDKPHIRAYHVGLIDALKLWPQGSVILCRVKAGEMTLGCVFHYVENGHLMFTKGGMTQFEDAKLKPGFITHLACMEECRQRSLVEEQSGKTGLLKYDFLSGEGSTQYKDSLSNVEGHLISATAERGLLMWLINSAKIVKSMLKKGKR